MLKMLVNMVKGVPTCRRTAAFLLDYVEGKLDPKTVALFEAHIAMCPNCELYLRQYRETVRLLNDMPPPEPPAELAEATSQFLRSSLDAPGL